MISKYLNYYHGLNLYPSDAVDHYSRDNENGILFLAQALMLKSEIDIIRHDDIATFNLIAIGLKTNGRDTIYDGLFDRGKHESLLMRPSEINTISHDNISAIASFSHAFGLSHHRKIYQHGMKNFWRFDNAYPDSPRWSRIMHPRDIIFWSRLGATSIVPLTISMMFMPIFYLSMIITCYKKWHVRPSLFHRVRTFLFPKKYPDSGYRAKHYAASGKLLAYVRLYPLRKISPIARLVWRVCVYLVNKHHKDGYAYAFYSHFENRNKEHPNVILAKKVFK